MKIKKHANHTEELFGIRAEDVHKWIDGFFDYESFDQFIRTGRSPGNNLYEHRQFRHCVEALDEAYEEFKEKYSKEEIKNIFETHIKDDYEGYIPHRIDFKNGMFTEKYHESKEHHLNESILTRLELSEYFDGNTSTKHPVYSTKISTGFYFKILLPTIIAIILFISSIFIIILPLFHSNMIEQRKQMLKELTMTASSIVDNHISKVKSGELEKTAAMKNAINSIKNLRYGRNNKDYFWITDMHPKMIMHPYRTDLIGKDLRNYKDSKNRSGKKLFVKFVDLVNKSGEGYLEYRWQWMDNKTKIAPKLSYVRGIPEWNLIIGTGIYINDIKEDMLDLKTKLVIAFSAISFFLLIILANILYQSHKLEVRRKMSELGLMEAKERYRALVESTSEGYILELGGEILYSNRVLHRILEYSDKEIAKHNIFKKILTDVDHNNDIKKHISLLFLNKSRPGQFEAQIKTKSNKLLDVIITTSKIFFHKKNGHVISFRTIIRKKTVSHSITQTISSSHDEFSTLISEQISNSTTLGGVVKSLNQVPTLIRDMVDRGTNPENLRDAIGTSYDAAIKKFINLSIEELGQPPTKFSFLSLGSNARHEMTMFSDQDSALIFEDVNELKLNDTKRYFLNLSNRVCKKLDQAGYPYCPGDIMAVNPKYCLPLTAWKDSFSSWIMNADSKSIFEVNVFFDIYNASGNNELFDELSSHILKTTEKTPEFLLHYAKNCLLYRPPLNLFGQIKTKDNFIDLKECLRPIELFARVYSLKYNINANNTIHRLHILAEKKILKEKSVQEITFVFDYIWQLRFKNQLFQYAELRPVNDKLNLSTLTDIEQQNLKNTLNKILDFQTILSYDFFGVPLG